MINLSKVNLNLLTIFDALMEERHLTKAGKKLHLSQPAVSYALKGLRELFDDKLFIKSAEGMIPTTKALALIVPIKNALLQIYNTINEEDKFEAKDSTLTFKLGLSDYASFVFLPKIRKLLEQEAPSVMLEVLHLDKPETSRLLDKGDIDIAIGVFDKSPTRLEHELLYNETIVCVADQNNQLLKKGMTLKIFTTLPHLLIAFREDPPFVIQKTLAAKGISRTVAMTIPHVMTAGYILQGSNLIAAMPLKVANAIATNLGLKIYDLPFKIQPFPVYALWHKQNASNKSHCWLRALICRAAKMI